MSVSSIIDKMSSRDKDYRYMATSDLLGELQKDSFKMDHDGERKLCQMIIKLLSDAAGDVQGLAVKCLPLLVRKVQTQHVEDMVDKLFQMVKNGKEEERDISSIGLKTVLAEVPQSAAGTTVHGLTPRLLDGIGSSSMEVTVCCLEILHDVLTHFPSLVSNDLAKIRAKLLPELASPRATVRKRAVTSVGALCGSLPDSLYVGVVDHLIEQISACAPKGAESALTTYIQAVSAIGRASGFRLGAHLPRVVPLILKCASDAKGASESGTEVAEHCLQACEAFVSRCPAEVTPFIPQLLELGLQYVKFDPNYADDEDDGAGDAMDDEDEEEEDDFGDDYSDDDDTSWKVRRAATKLLSALISSKPEAVPGIFAQLCPALLARFSEREESVKADVFATTRLLVLSCAAPALRDALLPTLRAELPRIVGALQRQLKRRSIKTRSGVFVLLRELASTLPGGLADHVGVLFPAIERALRDKSSSSALRMEVLTCLRLVLDSHEPAVLHPHLKPILQPVIACVSDRYYKITAEALRVCGSLTHVLRPSPPEPSPLSLAEYVGPLYTAVEARLAALDQDQEVKEASIMTMGVLVASVGDALADRLDKALPILLDRLRNEITRLTAVRAFEAIAASPLPLDLQPTIPALLSELTSYLRKNNRMLRQASLLALGALTRRHAGSLSEGEMREIVVEVAPILSDKDLQLSASALQLLLALVQADSAKVGPLIAEHVMAPFLALLASPLLQGAAIVRMQELLRGAVSLGAHGLPFDSLLKQLLAVGAGTDGASAGAKQTLTSVAMCVAALCDGTSAAQRHATVEQFMAGIGAKEVSTQLLSLYCLGQIGRHADLAAEQSSLLPALTATFESAAEEVKAAGAFALGSIASGNVGAYLPLLVGQISDPARAAHHYLLLHALKELILCAPGEALQPHVGEILPLLLSQAERTAEEGVRTVVSECLGKLLMAAPAAVLPPLHQSLGHAAAPMRAIAVSSLRFAIVDHPSALDAELPRVIADFLRTLSDADLKVRHAALLALSCVAHNQPHYVTGCLPQLLPPLYAETAKKAELVHQVDLGPFKHTVDDGLELRKAAFECMDTLLESCADSMELQPFIERLVAGLTDDYDIKMLCHLVLCKMATRPNTSVAVLSMLEQICEPLRKTVSATLKDNAVKQEIERHEELVRSGLRVSYLLSKVSGAEGAPKFDEYVRQTLKQGKLAARYEAICAEVDGADDDAEPMSM